ncbi:MAG TPA: carboxypeptidase regulatory-like domain-containing protein [Candidatus Acidoferrum sp.]|nr:carboxypeptidase regulatory-like domain-containing protein [Candidatus Acidoferrum sp.]
MNRLRLSGCAFAIAALILMLCGTPGVLGQEVTATITGTVTDPSGAAIAGANVTAKSVERGETHSAVTNDVGLYRITQLPIGNYELRIEKDGFQTTSYPAFNLALNQVARIDPQLKMGQVAQTIEVTGAAPVLKTESTQVDTIINAATNDNLPLASRNYVQLTLLAPGSVSTDPSSFSSGNNTGGYGARPLINGNREQANNFLLDGMDNNQVSDNLLGYTPAPDAIEEFNLITNNAPAEFGNFMGGIVSAAIKSGTNSYHGDAWEFFRNDKLNANSWSNNFNGNPRDKLRWNMFGGTLGGPIFKNKLYFFADYQGQRFDIPSSTSSFGAFSPAEQGGDFSALCPAGFTASGVCTSTTGANTQLYNPCAANTGFNGVTCTAAAPPRNPFPFNQICGISVAVGTPCPAMDSMISPVAKALFASPLYPKSSNGAPLISNATNTSVSAFNVNQGDLKVDYKATDKDNISGRFTRAYQNNPSTNSQLLFGDGFSTTPIYNIVGDWARVIRPNFVNDARVGWSHVTLNSGNSFASAVGAFGNTIGIGNGNPSGVSGLLALNFSNSALSSGPGAAQPALGQAEQTQSFDDHVWQVEDSATWTRGVHSFKFGGQYFRQTIKTFYAGNNGELGLMDFDGRFTSNVIGSGGSGAGDGGADFFLGLPFQYGRGISTGQTWEQWSNIFAFYGQDTWRVSAHLTLNLGLRYEAHTPWEETNNHQANYNFATGNIDIAGQNGASRALYRGFYGGRDFQPRIGFAWTPAMLGQRTVVRGAFTISSYLEGTGTNLRLPINAPFSPAEINRIYNNLALPTTTTSDGIVGSAAGASCAPPAFACYAGAFLRVWDPNVQPAIDDQWNLTIQHQFWGDTTFQIGYVGQRAVHLMVPFDYAQRVLLPATAACPAPCTGPSPFFAKNPTLYNVLGHPNANPPVLDATVSGTQSNGTMRYNSLQAVLHKTMSKGLQYQVAYTYSKCMSNSTGYYGAWNNASSASAYWQNVYDPKAEWAPCYYDATHVISAYGIYELPFGKGKQFGSSVNSAVNQVIGGWQVSPIISWRTGWPLPTSAADTSGTFGRGPRANCNGSLPSTSDTPIVGAGGIQWFTNNGNFTQPANGTFGSCAPQLGGLRTPHFTDVDLGIAKNFQMTERLRLQFRTDFINAFNHVQLNVPNTTCCGTTMGQITSAQPPRNIQLALKLYF